MDYIAIIWAGFLLTAFILSMVGDAMSQSSLPTRRITDGPCWAVLLPDGAMRTHGNGVVSLWKHRHVAEYWLRNDECVGRVVRVRSVTYEIEEDR